MNTEAINQLEADIRLWFPLGEGLSDQYASGFIDDAVNGIGTEYLEIGYELSAMYFDDALCFLHIILRGELRLFAENKLDQCFMCVVYLIEKWGDQCTTRLSAGQRSTLCRWLRLLSKGRGMMSVTTDTLEDGLRKAFCALNEG